MTISRVNPSGWLSGNRITQAQVNQLDIDHANAVDKNGDAIPGAMSFAATIYAAAGILLGGTSKVTLTPRSLVRAMRSRPVQAVIGQWANGGSGLAALFMKDLVANGVAAHAGAELFIPLDVPHGAALNSVSVYILPAYGHSALPLYMPKAQLMKYDCSGAFATAFIGSAVTDPSANVPAYEVTHPITVPGLSTVIDNSSFIYGVVLTSEGSTNSLINLIYSSTLASFTTSSMDDGAT